MKIGELFAGYGGLGMGVQAALGGEIAWFSEFDKGPSKILEHRFPGIPNHGDITKIDWSQVEPVDVLTGGSPCQDLSGAGKRQGMTEGTRSNLWVAMREAIAQLRPHLVVWENVRGAGSAGADSALPTPTTDDAGNLTRDSGEFQSLTRAVINLLPTPRATEMEESAETFIARQQRMAEAGRTRGDSGMPLNVAVSLLPTPAVNDMGAAYTPEEWDAWTAKMQAEHGNGNGHGKSLNIEAQRLGDGPHRHVRRLVETQGPRPVGACCGAHTQSWRLEDGTDYGPAVRRWHDLFHCAPPPSEEGPKGGRRLSARFSEWMMGLPAGWVTDVPDISRNEALKALGNGVVPQQATAAILEMFAWAEVAA